MALPNGAHVEIGGVGYKLDEAYERITGRRCYVHGGRSIFAPRTDITGLPGSQNLREDILAWAITDWEGEGQVVLRREDPDSARRFYRSEGLNFRVPGQVTLNKSILADSVKTTASSSTVQGSAFTDVVGTSTTSGTDRTLVAINDQIGDPTGITPGAINVTVEFHIYRETFASTMTTIQGSSFQERSGDTATSGTDIILRTNGRAWTAKLDTDDELPTEGVPVRVDFYAFIGAPTDTFYSTSARFQVIDVTAEDKAVASTNKEVERTTAPTDPNVTLFFVPLTGHSYRLHVHYLDAPGGGRLHVDKVDYGPVESENVAQVEIYNSTDGTTKALEQVTINSTSTTDTKNKAARLSFRGVAGKTYKARVSRIEGYQKLVVDKVVYDQLAAADWEVDCLDFGIEQNIFAAAHSATATTNSAVFKYDNVNDEWDHVANL